MMLWASMLLSQGVVRYVLSGLLSSDGADITKELQQ